MVDTKKIEELRALAYASIPSTFRKAQHTLEVSSSGKRQRCAREDEKEEGELSSDEETVGLAQASSLSTGISPFSSAPSTAASLPTYLKTMGKQNCQSLSDVNSIPVSITDAISPTVVNSVLTNATPQNFPLSNDFSMQRSSSMFSGGEDLASHAVVKTSMVQKPKNGHDYSHFLATVSNVALPVGVMRKGAGASLSSLNIPLCPRPPILQGEKTDSLVIKFSDEDSDSDGECEQFGAGQWNSIKNNIENHNFRNGLLGSTALGGHSANPSNQSTVALKSEIDRMKKQIAAMERAKGKSNPLTLFGKSSKSSSVDMSQQVTLTGSNAGLTTGQSNSKSDLESLRQQIAVKESELYQRKLWAGKELGGTVTGTGNGTLIAGSASGQAGHRGSSMPGITIDMLGPSALKEFLAKSTGHELVSSSADEMQTDVTGMPSSLLENCNMVSNDPIFSVWKNHLQQSEFEHGTVMLPGSQKLNVLATDSLTSPTVDSTTNSQNREVPECRTGMLTQEEIPERQELGKEKNQLPVAQNTRPIKMHNPLVCKTSSLTNVLHQTSSKRKHSDAQQTGSCKGIKKHKLDELLTHLLPLSPLKAKGCSLVSSSTEQQYMKDALLRSTLERNGSGSDNGLHFTQNEGLHQLTKNEVFTKGTLVTNSHSPGQSLEPVIFFLPERAVHGDTSGSIGKGSRSKLETGILGSSSTNVRELAVLQDGNAHNLGIAQLNARVLQGASQEPYSGTKVECAWHGNHIAPMPAASRVSQSILVVQSSDLREQTSVIEGTRPLSSDANLHIESLTSEERLIEASNAISSSGVIGQAERMNLLSNNGRDLQGPHIGRRSIAASNPIWSSENAMHTIASGSVDGIADQGYQFGSESLNQLKQEEDLVDKQLEEAQKNRCKCEVMERLARRQYREAQEALHAANWQCDLLYEKRERLAAEIQSISKQVSLCPPIQQHERPLLPYCTLGGNETPFVSIRMQQIFQPPEDCRVQQGSLGSDSTTLPTREVQESVADPASATQQITELRHTTGELCSPGRAWESESGCCHREVLHLEQFSDVQTEHTTNPLFNAEGIVVSDGFSLQQAELRPIIGDPSMSCHSEETEAIKDCIGSSVPQCHVNGTAAVSVSSSLHERKERVSVTVHVSNDSTSPSSDEAVGSSLYIANKSKVATLSERVERILNSDHQMEAALGLSSASFAMDSDKPVTNNHQVRMNPLLKDRSDMVCESRKSFGDFDGHLCPQSVFATGDIKEMQKSKDYEERHVNRSGQDGIQGNSGIVPQREMFLISLDATANLKHASSQLPFSELSSHKAATTDSRFCSSTSKLSCFPGNEEMICYEDVHKECKHAHQMAVEDVPLKPFLPSITSVALSTEANLQEMVLNKNEEAEVQDRRKGGELGVTDCHALNSGAEFSNQGRKILTGDSGSVLLEGTEELFISGSQMKKTDRVFNNIDQNCHQLLRLQPNSEDTAIDGIDEGLKHYHVNRVSPVEQHGSLSLSRQQTMNRYEGEETVKSDAIGLEKGTCELKDFLVEEELLTSGEEEDGESMLSWLFHSDARDFNGWANFVSEQKPHRLLQVETENVFRESEGRDLKAYRKCHAHAVEVEPSVSNMFSSKLKLLFKCAQGFSFDMQTKSMHMERSGHSHPEADWAFMTVPSSYESPLDIFRSYGNCSQFSALFHLADRRYAIDPFIPICKFEHRGRCNNDDCPWQHKKDYMVLQLQSHVGTDISARENHDTRMLEANRISLLHSDSFVEDLFTTSNETNRPIVRRRLAESKWSNHILKPPVYRIGSHLIKQDPSLAVGPTTSCTEKFSTLGFCQTFSVPLPIHRQLLMDMPCLLDSSVTDVISGSTISSRLHLPGGHRGQSASRVEAEEHHFQPLEDVESCLEVALSFIDFDSSIENPDGAKSALYVLSRALESKPSSVALWVVYLHLFYRREKSVSKDDMFFHAVQYNKDSYELWLLFINSRERLMEKLEAYQLAISTLSNMDESKECHLKGQRFFLLDLVLQMLNCMCVSGLVEEALAWIDGLVFYASEDGTDNEMAVAYLLLTSLTKHDACVLWVCCAYIAAHSQLPSCIIERLGYRQQLPLGLSWGKGGIAVLNHEHVMRFMETASSNGRGCLALDSMDLSWDKNTCLSKSALAVNFVHCAAVFEGVDRALMLGKKFMRNYCTSVELIVACVHLEELQGDKKAGLNIFEEALSFWPQDQPGILRLWNQYIGHAYDIEGKDFVRALLARCSAQIKQANGNNHRSDSKVISALYLPSTILSVDNVKDQKLSLKCADEVRQSFWMLPSITHQLSGIREHKTRVFSNQDVVFGYLNLAFLEALEGDIIAARMAADRALETALNEEDMQHCLKEVAALTFVESANSVSLKDDIMGRRMIGLVDRCFTESQLLTKLQPLSRRLSDSIKKRRVRLFLEHLLGPLSADYSLLNSILETCYGPALLPVENTSLKDICCFAEGILEVAPANISVATSVCNIVQHKLKNCNLIRKNAALFWSSSLLINSLCQSSPPAPELSWLEASHFVEQLGVDSLADDFYQHALATYPFSVSLWHRFLAVCSRMGKLATAVEAIKVKGLTVDTHLGDQIRHSS